MPVVGSPSVKPQIHESSSANSDSPAMNSIVQGVVCALACAGRIRMQQQIDPVERERHREEQQAFEDDAGHGAVIRSPKFTSIAAVAPQI